MDWLLHPGPLGVNTIVWFVVSAIGAALVCDRLLYPMLLTSLVRNGDWHPANLRRLLWWLFLFTLELVVVWLLRDRLRLPSYGILTLFALSLAAYLYLTRRLAASGV